MSRNKPHLRASSQGISSLFEGLSAAEQQRIRALEKRSEREKVQRCLIEGEHLCSEYLGLVESERAFKPHVVVVQITEGNVKERVESLAIRFIEAGARVYAASARTFQLLSDAHSPQGILAVIDYPNIPLETDKPLIILDGVADPGNVGTIVRTAEWFGFRNILLGEGCADRFHPKTLRSTMGAAFRCAVQSAPNLALTLQEQFPQHRLYGASLQGAHRLADVDLTGLFGIVMGSEAHGISPSVQEILRDTFRIGRASTSEAESLNVAVAAGVILHHLASILAEM